MVDVKSSHPCSSLHGMLPYFPSCRDALSGHPQYFNVIQIKLTYSLATFYFGTFKRITPATLHRSIELTVRYVESFDLPGLHPCHDRTNDSSQRDLLGKWISQERWDFDFWGFPDCGKYENYNNQGTFGRWIR